MSEIFEIATRSFWHFVGVWIIISIPFHTAFKMWNRYWRHKSIREHGYPPGTDADGDFKED